MSWPVKEAGPFEEISGEVVLDYHTLGYHPDVVFRAHEFHFTNLGAGTASVYVWGAGGDWSAHGGPVANNSVVQLEGASPRFRFVFAGTGGAGKVSVRSTARGF